MGRQIFSAVTLAALSMAVLLTSVSGMAAIQNDRFTATWDPPTDPRAVYEFRWRHFAQSAWQDLPEQDARALSFLYAYPALPTEPITDRWMCLDARSRVGDLVSPWLSETDSGAACAAVEVGTISLPIPPPPTPPQPEIFTNVRQANGQLSVEYQIGACPRGVQQTTSAVIDGSKTITLKCRR